MTAHRHHLECIYIQNPHGGIPPPSNMEKSGFSFPTFQLTNKPTFPIQKSQVNAWLKKKDEIVILGFIKVILNTYALVKISVNYFHDQQALLKTDSSLQ